MKADSFQNTKMVRKMAMDSVYFIMEPNMKVIIKTVKKKVKENIPSQMVKFMREIGKMISIMA